MGAFLVPILVILVINVVIFIWVITVVIRHAREKAARKDKTITNKQIVRMTVSISGVLFLFGLSWLFFVLTFSVSGLRETFQILFTVFNSLQGFFVFAFILFTEGFDYWKALLSCEKHKTKHSSHGTNVSTKKQGTDLSTLPKQEKDILETSHGTFMTDHEMGTEILTTKDLEALQISTDMASPTDLVSADNSSSVHQINDIVYQNDQDLIGSEKQTSTKPLKSRVKRYSTKKYNKHHVEVMKVDFYSEDSSNSDEDDAAAT